MTVVPKFLVWLFFAILPVVFDVLVLQDQPGLQTETALGIINLFKSVYLMALIIALFAIWILYYLNFQIITNERLVDMTQKNLLYHTVSEVNLARIQDVTAEIHGFLGTFFDFGNVYIQTAAEKERFVFDNVPNPHHIAKLVLDLYEKLPNTPKGGVEELIANIKKE